MGNGNNPRRANGYRRDALRKRVAAMGLPCHICGKPIQYDLTTWVDPKDGKVKRHPMSFELDELVPVSKGGSPLDPENVAPAHRICNARRGNKPLHKIRGKQTQEPTENRLPVSREWLTWTREENKGGLPNSREW